MQQALTESFRRYGLPDDMLMDNGSPWGNTAEQVLTPLTVDASFASARPCAAILWRCDQPPTDEQFDVFFCHHKVAQIDVRHPCE